MNYLPKSDTPQTNKKWVSHRSTKIQFKELKSDYKARENQHILQTGTDYQKQTNLVSSKSILRQKSKQIKGSSYPNRWKPRTHQEVRGQNSKKSTKEKVSSRECSAEVREIYGTKI